MSSNSGNKSVGKNVTNKAKNTVSTGYQATKGAVSSGYQSFMESSLLVKIIVLVVVGVALYFLITWIISMVNEAKYKSVDAPYLITSPVNTFTGKRMVRNIVNPVNGLNFSYSWWMYIADWNYGFGRWKNVFVKGNKSRRCPGVWLYPKTNALHCRINTHADSNEGCDVKNIPLQKWVHCVYVLDNRTTEIYINGKLERSCVLRGVPQLNNDRLQIAADGGFYGQLSNMRYFTRALTPSDVADLYSEGPITSAPSDAVQDPGEEPSDPGECLVYADGSSAGGDMIDPDDLHNQRNNVSGTMGDMGGSVKNEINSTMTS